MSPRRQPSQFPGESQSPSPGEIVNYFENLPVEFAAIVVDILQARVKQRREVVARGLQQPPDAPPPPANTGTGSTPGSVPRTRRTRRGAVPLVPPQETVGDDVDTE